MEPDPAIVRLAERKGVYVVWGVASLVADLALTSHAPGAYRTGCPGIASTREVLRHLRRPDPVGRVTPRMPYIQR